MEKPIAAMIVLTVLSQLHVNPVDMLRSHQGWVFV